MSRRGAAPLSTRPAEKKKLRSVKRHHGVGAGNVTRTRDLLITNQLLYRLSYSSKHYAILIHQQLCLALRAACGGCAMHTPCEGRTTEPYQLIKATGDIVPFSSPLVKGGLRGRKVYAKITLSCVL